MFDFLKVCYHIHKIHHILIQINFRSHFKNLCLKIRQAFRLKCLHFSFNPSVLRAPPISASSQTYTFLFISYVCNPVFSNLSSMERPLKKFLVSKKPLHVNILQDRKSWEWGAPALRGIVGISALFQNLYVFNQRFLAEIPLTFCGTVARKQRSNPTVLKYCWTGICLRVLLRSKKIKGDRSRRCRAMKPPRK